MMKCYQTYATNNQIQCTPEHPLVNLHYSYFNCLTKIQDMFPYFENGTYLKAGHQQLVFQIKKLGNYYLRIILHRRMNNFFMYNNEYALTP